jgi:hypothetical protein
MSLTMCRLDWLREQLVVQASTDGHVVAGGAMVQVV